jgi:hypothetical protein
MGVRRLLPLLLPVLQPRLALGFVCPLLVNRIGTLRAGADVQVWHAGVCPFHSGCKSLPSQRSFRSSPWGLRDQTLQLIGCTWALQ